MAFKQKTWTDRVAEFINRRTLTHEDGTEEIVTVARNEGSISAEGDAFNAKTMNDLEQRIADEFDELGKSVSDGKTLVASAITAKGVETATDASFETMASNIESISSELISVSYANKHAGGWTDGANASLSGVAEEDGMLILTCIGAAYGTSVANIRRTPTLKIDGVAKAVNGMTYQNGTLGCSQYIYPISKGQTWAATMFYDSGEDTCVSAFITANIIGLE